MEKSKIIGEILRLKTPRLKAYLALQQSTLTSLNSIESGAFNGSYRLGGVLGVRGLSTTVRDKDSSLTGRNSRLYIYPELSKYRLSALVVVTSAAGFLCAGAPIDLCSLVAVTTGTALCAASAGTFNQVLERFHDAKMLRTRLRPLPSGRISTAEAFSWGATSGIAGTALLYTGTFLETGAWVDTHCFFNSTLSNNKMQKFLWRFDTVHLSFFYNLKPLLDETCPGEQTSHVHRTNHIPILPFPKSYTVPLDHNKCYYYHHHVKPFHNKSFPDLSWLPYILKSKVEF